MKFKASKNTYYIHSTGVIKGPNGTGKKLGNKNAMRQEFGNLFTSRRTAEKAQKRVQRALNGKTWFKAELQAFNKFRGKKS